MEVSLTYGHTHISHQTLQTVPATETLPWVGKQSTRLHRAPETARRGTHSERLNRKGGSTLVAGVRVCREKQIPEAVPRGGLQRPQQAILQSSCTNHKQSLLLVPAESRPCSSPGAAAFCSCLSWAPRASSWHSVLSHLLQITYVLKRTILLLWTLLSLLKRAADCLLYQK